MNKKDPNTPITAEELEQIRTRLAEIIAKTPTPPPLTPEDRESLQTTLAELRDFMEKCYEHTVNNPDLTESDEAKDFIDKMKAFKETEELVAEVNYLRQRVQNLADFYYRRALKRLSDGSPN